MTKPKQDRSASTKPKFTITLGNPEDIGHDYGEDQNLGVNPDAAKRSESAGSNYYGRAITYLYQYDAHVAKLQSFLAQPYLYDNFLDRRAFIQGEEVPLPVMRHKQKVMRQLQVIFNTHLNPAYLAMQKRSSLSRKAHETYQKKFQGAIQAVLEDQDLEEFQFQNLPKVLKKHLDEAAYAKAFATLYDVASSQTPEPHAPLLKDEDWVHHDDLQKIFTAEITDKITDKGLEKPKRYTKKIPQLIETLEKTIPWQFQQAKLFVKGTEGKSTWARLNRLHDQHYQLIDSIKPAKDFYISRAAVSALIDLYLETAKDRDLNKHTVPNLFKEITLQWLAPEKRLLKAETSPELGRKNTFMRLGDAAKNKSHSMHELFHRGGDRRTRHDARRVLSVPENLGAQMQMGRK